MRALFNLIKRNCKVFLRDRAAVFFSLLSMIIVLLLMIVFLGEMNVDNVVSLLKQYAGERTEVADKENAKVLVEWWTIAGILVVNSITVSMTVIQVFINDLHEKKIPSFYITPMKKYLISLSYICSAIIISSFFCSITFLAAQLYVGFVENSVLSIMTIIKTLFMIIICVTVFSVVMYFATFFVKTPSAWSGMSIIISTLVGFVGGIYLPMGSLQPQVAVILKYTPILHGTALMRNILMQDSLSQTFLDAPVELVNKYKEHMGIEIIINNSIASPQFQIFFLILCGIIILSMILLFDRKLSLTDR
jgi:multidrug/hemolysin transport system permease protein